MAFRTGFLAKTVHYPFYMRLDYGRDLTNSLGFSVRIIHIVPNGKNVTEDFKFVRGICEESHTKAVRWGSDQLIEKIQGCENRSDEALERMIELDHPGC
ncbi:hypothetical protein ACFL08_02835 [Patescibacteria group bacterium]